MSDPLPSRERPQQIAREWTTSTEGRRGHRSSPAERALGGRRNRNTGAPLRPARALAGVAIASLALAACDGRRAPPLVSSEAIGHLGRDYRKGSLTVSHDHRRLAWVEERADRCRVVLDGRKGPLLWRCLDPHLSRDGATLAYWAGPEPSEPPRGYLYVNQAQSPIAISGEGPIAFSREGGAWAAIAPAFDPDAPPATPDGEAKGTADGDGSPPRAPRHLIAFDERGLLGEHHDTTDPAVSPERSHVAYIAEDVEGRRSLIVDGAAARVFGRPEVQYLPVVKAEKPGPNLEPESTVRYLADGSLVTIGLAEKGWTVFHDDEVWATYPTVNVPKTGYEVLDPQLLSARTIVAGSLATAADAPVACWWERLEGEVGYWRVVCNGKPIDDQVCDNFWADSPIAVAADGRSAGYICPANPPLGADGMPSGLPPLSVVVAGARFGPYQFAWGVDLTADGRHYAYAAADSIDEPWFYIVDGKRYDGPWLQAFPPKLSPDGSSVVWAASQKEERGRIDLVVDGDIVARADQVMAPPLFRGNRKVQWAVKRGGSVRRVVVCTRWAPLDALRPLVCW